jgi:hypothetical protein
MPRAARSSFAARYLRAVARRLLALALLLAFVTLGASGAWAHSDEGVMTVTKAEQSGSNTVQLQAGIVYANDNDLAEQASVTATLTGPDGATVGPVALVLETGSLYGAAVEVPSPGTWQVDVSSSEPASSASATVTVIAMTESTAPATTATPDEVARAPLGPVNVEPDADDSSPVLWIVLAVAAVVVVGGGIVYAVRRSRG